MPEHIKKKSKKHQPGFWKMSQWVQGTFPGESIPYTVLGATREKALSLITTQLTSNSGDGQRRASYNECWIGAEGGPCKVKQGEVHGSGVLCFCLLFSIGNQRYVSQCFGNQQGWLQLIAKKKVFRKVTQRGVQTGRIPPAYAAFQITQPGLVGF